MADLDRFGSKKASSATKKSNVVRNFVLWKALVWMVRNVLGIDNRESRANSVAQTLHKHHITFLSWCLNRQFVIGPTRFVARLNHTVNFVSTQ